jgi:TonB family protein
MRDGSDPLEQGERVGRAVVVSAVCHVMLFSGSILWSAFHMPISLGNPDSRIGGAVAVTPVQGVPLTGSRAEQENPVANPVQHDVPAAIEKKPPPPEPPPPDAVEIEKQRKRVYAQKFSTRKKEAAPNQVPSSTGARANSPIFSGQKNTGAGVGFGTGSPFGSKFGWYADALQRRISEEWRKTLGQVSGRSRRPAVVSFRISRNGRIDNVRIAQTSANRSMDYSSFRAVLNSNPVRPLPPALGRSSITVEIWFQLK